MRQSLSLLAAISRTQPSKLKKPAISLDHFIQRQRVLSLWRDIVRALHSMMTLDVVPLSLKTAYLIFILQLEAPPSPTRDELRSYARHEFERNREVTDLALTVSHTLSDLGKAEFETMRRYIDEQITG
ncbi:uncharacterized protein N7458_000790 [Penicillium daleae]|uniref:Uncharacterized protein n=1 Tax=Penicillium daleae TaxID=63821 RepID=A0AAD6G8M5_9EURO|nr:uncharacterized protein N7458_000790 [Penicillium daleae]KAJ5465104.1 hypothetical protein N7458_000790 [Penicillium daleae]